MLGGSGGLSWQFCFVSAFISVVILEAAKQLRSLELALRRLSSSNLKSTLCIPDGELDGSVWVYTMI